MTDDSFPVSSVRLAISGAELNLGRGEHVIGRSADCAIRIDDPLTSRHHAAIAVSAEGVTVRDLRSRNGVLVNGEEIDGARTLVSGDLITVGSQPFKVLEICRAGAPAQPPRPDPALRGAALARIAVIRRAVPEDEETTRSMAAMTTLGRENGLFERPHASYVLLAEAAAKAIAEGRAERAERILGHALADVLEGLRVRRDMDDQIVAIAIQEALSLAEATGKRRWADYVRDVYVELRMAMPPELRARLSSVTRDPTEL